MHKHVLGWCSSSVDNLRKRFTRYLGIHCYYFVFGIHKEHPMSRSTDAPLHRAESETNFFDCVGSVTLRGMSSLNVRSLGVDSAWQSSLVSLAWVERYWVVGSFLEYFLSLKIMQKNSWFEHLRKHCRLCNARRIFICRLMLLIKGF